jgi:hypothetical protein
VQVGDLVKIKYDGVVALITKIENVDRFHREGPTNRYTLLGQPVTFRASQIEVINASR